MKSILFSLSVFLGCNGFAQMVERPPQFIIMAFDGSYSLSMWQETLDLAKNQPFKFTYFISGVYFLLEQNKTNYAEPTHGIGKSAIGWGGKSISDLHRRVSYVNKAYDTGHEIASHGNGHFEGTTWTLPQWNSEITQFYNLIFNIFKINSVPGSNTNSPFHFRSGEIIGFRAPLLGINASMYRTLNDFKYAYDTSQTAATNYWPEVKNNLWNFPLAELRIAGTGKRTLSMDYNFYFTQSKGLPDPANYKTYKNEMVNTYLNYFKSNYYGNRAPLNIGHHFSKWNDGAYWDAFKEFSHEVCGLPEVKCVTYRDLLAYVTSVDPLTLAAYRKGDFEKLSADSMTSVLRNIPPPLEVDLLLLPVQLRNLKVITQDSKQALAHKKLTYRWLVNGLEVTRSSVPELAISDLTVTLRPADVLSVSLMVESKEIQRTSHRVLSVSANEVRFEAFDLEFESLKGDMPDAHLNEPL